MTVKDETKPDEHAMRPYPSDHVGALCDSRGLTVLPVGKLLHKRSLVSFCHVKRPTFSPKPYKSLPLTDCMAPISQEREDAKETDREGDLGAYISLLRFYPAGRTPH